MADGGDADGLVIVGQLVDDPIAPHAHRAQAAQTAAQAVPAVGLALEHAECILDGVNQGPVQVEQLLSRASGENDFCHASAGASTLRDLVAKFVESDAVTSRQFGEPGFDL